MGDLPPGFRFYPTDEELVVHFLHRKAALLPCHPDVIPDLELYPYDPWDLDGKALSEGRMWYYYSRRTSSIRMTESGCWKPMGIDDEPVYSNTTGKRVGMKKYYTFHLGYDDDDSSSDHEYSSSTMGWTNWVMHEYRLPDRRSTSSSSSSSTRRSRSSRSSSSDHSRWVICKVFEENNDSGGGGAQLSCLDEVFLSMDDSCYDEIISSFPTN